jgi:drug/metabolite transporter (DMT)-like permease
LLTNPRVRIFVGAILISFSPVFVRLVEISPTASAFYRVAIGGAALAAFLILTGRWLSFSRYAWLALILSAAFFSLDLWFWHRSIIYIGPGLSTLLANMQVFFMIAAGIVALKQRPTRLELIAAVLAFLGLAMITGPQWNSAPPGYRLGVGLGILTAISYAGYMLSMRSVRLRSQYVVPIREIAVMSLLAAAILGSVAVAEGTDLALSTSRDAGWMLAYGLMSHAVGLIFIASSLDRVSTTVTGIALLLQPSLSFVWDVIFFSRPTTALEVAGAMIALAAIFLGTVRR